VKSLSVNYYFYILGRLETMGLNRQDTAGIIPLSMEKQTGPENRIDIQALMNFSILLKKT